MNHKLKRVLLYVCFAVGIGLITSMDRELSKRNEIEKIYRRMTDPIIEESFSKIDTNVATEERNHKRELVAFWRVHLNGRMDPDLARWLMLGGFVLVLFGGKAFEKKSQKNKK